LEAEFEAGVSCSELARRHVIHKMTVVRQLRRAGVDTKCRSLASSSELVSRVQELGEQGLSERRIAKAVGVSSSSVHRLLALVREGRLITLERQMNWEGRVYDSDGFTLKHAALAEDMYTGLSMVFEQAAAGGDSVVFC